MTGNEIPTIGLHHSGSSAATAGRPGRGPQITAPAPTLPKGGGAIRGVGEKFAANPVTGTGSMSVPIATSPGRAGFGPSLSLSYDSGSGNGPFGFGWSLSLPSITRKTDNGLPQYRDSEDSDVFLLSGAEDLVPVYRQDPNGEWTGNHSEFTRDADGSWVRDAAGRLLAHEDDIDGHRVRRYRPRIEGLFARIERWADTATGQVHWRSITRDNVTTLYGTDNESRIFDPANPTSAAPTRIFSWLIRASYDDKGNAIVYNYAAENDEDIDPSCLSQSNRVRSANRYVKRIRYGNRTPNRDPVSWEAWHPAQLPDDKWMFEVVFDYDEGHYEEVALDSSKPEAEQHRYVVASHLPDVAWDSASRGWSTRPDVSTSQRSGFAAGVSTLRRCRRILSFHHIPDLPTGEPGYEGLVRATEFDYADLDDQQPFTVDDELAHQGSTRFASFIRSVTQSGFVRDDDQVPVIRSGVSYPVHLKKSLPPLEFEYSKTTICDHVLEADAQTLENLPAGVDGSTHRWVDLDGEGISGILTERSGEWYYKANLGGGAYGSLQTVTTKPSLAALNGGRQQLLDLAGDGNLDLVDFSEPTPGFYERTADQDWAPFRTLPQLPRIDWDDPNLRLVDLDGNGHADVLITQDDVFTWYPSLAEDGFGPAQTARRPSDEERGPRLVFADRTQSIYLADMNGDGLTDLVRIRNGEVCFWPSYGFGRFAAKVTLDNSPWFDRPDQFDQRRVRLADIDGSGTTDIIYLHGDGVRLYLNQSGNRLTDPRVLRQFPPIDNTTSVTTADVLGNGTACLVWSSPLPGAGQRPLRYVDLMGSWPAFSADDFTDLRALADRLTNPARAIDTWLSAQLTEEASAALAGLDHTVAKSRRLRIALADSLNSLIMDRGSIHTAQRFAGVDLRVETKERLAKAPDAGDPRHLNRLLLEDAYPAELARHHSAKPHLLIKTVNNLGAETHVRYVPSTHFYLEDKLAGHPWITRLPFPVHVIERVITADRVSGNRFVTRYAYHHGHFDGMEREFRGFGLVEQWDTEELAALAGGQASAGTNTDTSSNVPPVLTRTWFHTGPYLGREHVSDFFAGLLDGNDVGEYYREPGLSDPQARELLLDDTVLPDGLTVDEEREACRALKGSMLRQEVYALDGVGQDADYPFGQPYTVVEQSFAACLVQPRGDNRHAVFFTHPNEAITYHYERGPSDPRIQHALTLEVDRYGNVRKEASVGYGRRQSPLTEKWDRDRQERTLVTYTETDLTNPIDDMAAHPDDYRTPLPAETRTYELTGYPPTGTAGRYRAQDFVQPDMADPTRLVAICEGETDYEDVPPDDKQRRLIERARTLYRCDDLTAFLPAGAVGRLAPPGESYRLAFTPGLLAQVFRRPLDLIRPSGAPPPEDLLPNAGEVLPIDPVAGKSADRGGYVDLEGDGQWWIPSGRVFYSATDAGGAAQELAHARQHFFLPRRYRDPFHTAALSTETIVTYDTYDLLVAQTTDALSNMTQARNDYRVLQPALVADPNHNRTEVAFDALGSVAGTAVMGKIAPAPAEGDSLDGFAAALTQAQIDGFYDVVDPSQPASGLLNKATTRIIYDLDRFWRTQRDHPQAPEKWLPAYAATLARETHVGDAPSPGGLKIQISFSYSDGFGREIQKKVQAEPESLVPGGPHPRWVVSGWTVYNNKGRPVRQYEPFFSQLAAKRHHFEFGVKVGVSPVLFYDPLERVVATLHPNHSYEKVVFDSWRRVTYDVNDTVAASGLQTGDPRTDPDIAGYISASFKAQPPNWQTWYQERIGNLPGEPEHDAAQKAVAHADTPSVAHFDALGRPFLTVAHNRVVCPGHVDDSAEEMLCTRVELDIEGNHRAVVDAKGRVAMRYSHCMAGPDEDEKTAGANRIHEAGMDAGEHWVLNDVAGNAIRAWDSRGFVRRMTYDELRRPTGLYVTEKGAERLAEQTIYGEGQGAATNHRTRVYQLRDAAGIATSAAYDFKGNLLEGRRDFLPIEESKLGVDWKRNLVAGDGSYTSKTEYDALNRPHTFTSADGSVHRRTFNYANLLDTVEVNLRGTAAATPFVTNLDYNAKGQRTQIAYGNGVTTTYAYDPLTFRLSELKTTRPPGLNGFASQILNDATRLQDLRYTYDPAGNITRIKNAALKAVTYNNQQVDPASDYTYDALYRLIEAEGREHIGQTAHSFNPDNYRDFDQAGLAHLSAHPNDLQSLRNYTERYAYDEVGNFEHLRHIAEGGSWTRHYDYEEDSPIESGAKSNQLTRTQLGNNINRIEAYTHDAHGNMTSIPHLPEMVWDFEDQLQRVDLVGGGTVWYVYDAGGERVRKVIERPNGKPQKERLYLGGFEVYRAYGANGAAVTLQRETLHVMDDEQRIALVETEIPSSSGPRAGGAVPLIRYQIGNHLGSASLELAEDGALISYEEYHPYGTTAIQAGRSVAEVSLKRYRYTGKERDEETGFSYHDARYYAPWMGRWMSCDPEMAKYTPDAPYLYSSNNPLRYIDKEGRSATETAMSGLNFGLQALRVLILGALGMYAGMFAGGVAGGVIGGIYGGPWWFLGGSLLGAIAGAAVGFVAGAAYGLSTWKWARRKAWNWIRDAPKSAWAGMKTAGTSVWNWAKSFGKSAWSGVSATASGAWSWSKGVGKTVWSGIQSVWKGISTATGTIRGAMDKAWSGLKSAVGWISERVAGFFRDSGNTQSGPSTTKSHARTPQSRIENKVREVIEGHFVGPLLPVFNPLGAGIDPIGSGSDADTEGTRAPESTTKGPLLLFEPGIGFGYSYTRSSGGRRMQFSLGFSPNSELVPYYPGGAHQPFSGPSRGYFLGFKLKTEW
ncbi:SpvB/TcaC N-terminal domain-containing protein [Gordonia rhizosphera]|uniref:Toxin n=1 Tax=Gordonia rhizosphera NBRC 16068 TaxID=1108045 RepID=K6VCG4_9ACTN|nr:SpvB/TcaC N-terminal domain-containing protein [Gordonia rhizosphera]GAB93888.1 hypothetical protein GORHZ_247_00260 [Gordonia rhizosphera NBRC 16068]